MFVSNVSVMKMHVVHEATDDTDQWMGLFLILLSHFVIFLIKACVLLVRKIKCHLPVYILNAHHIVETLTVCMFHLLYLL